MQDWKLCMVGLQSNKVCRDTTTHKKSFSKSCGDSKKNQMLNNWTFQSVCSNLLYNKSLMINSSQTITTHYSPQQLSS